MLVCVVASSPGAAHAQDPAAVPGYARAPSCVDRLDDRAVAERVDWIVAHLQRGAPRAKAWRYGWLAGMGAIAIYQSVVAARVHSAGSRFANIAGASGAGVLVVAAAALPAPEVWGARRIRRKPHATPEARRAQLRYAEEVLADAARIQRKGRSYLPYAWGLAFAVTMGTTLQARYGHTRSALTMYLGGPAITVARVLTQPTHAIRAYDRYQGRYCEGQYVVPARAPRVDRVPTVGATARRTTVSVTPAPGGLGLRVRF